MLTNYLYVIDLWRPPMVTLELQQNEDSGRTISFKIEDNAADLDITGWKVRLDIIKPDEKIVGIDCTIKDATRGIATAIITEQAVAVDGKPKMQLLITDTAGKVRTRLIPAIIKPSVDLEGAVTSTSEFENLTEAIDAANQVLEESRQCRDQSCECATHSANSAEAAEAASQSAQASKDAAVQEVLKAAAEVDKAKTEALAASESAGEAKASATAAARSATTAEQHKTAAATSEQAAKASETASADSATEASRAKDSAITARKATTALKAEVEGIRDGIVTEEAARQAAEVKRSSAEKSRADAEAERVQTEQSRATTAARDHQTAVEDHAKHQSMVEAIESMESGQLVSDVAEIKAGKADLTYVDDRFTQLIGAAPEALDTLEELALALGNQADFATQITSQLAEKASKTSVAQDIDTAKKGLESKISAKASKSDVDSALAGKVDLAAHQSRANEVDTALADKVDKVPGKSLSSEDFTSSEKSKLAGIEAGATAIEVINRLDSTSTTKALAPDRGRYLNEKINSTNSSIGNLASLETSAKNNLVAAVNELHDRPVGQYLGELTSEPTSATKGDWYISTDNGYRYIRGYNGTSWKAVLVERGIVDNLTTDNTFRPISAAQGKVLKDLIDSHEAESVASAAGAHGIRYHADKLEYKSGSTWTEIETGGGGAEIVVGTGEPPATGKPGSVYLRIG